MVQAALLQYSQLLPLSTLAPLDAGQELFSTEASALFNGVDFRDHMRAMQQAIAEQESKRAQFTFLEALDNGMGSLLIYLQEVAGDGEEEDHMNALMDAEIMDQEMYGFSRRLGVTW